MAKTQKDNLLFSIKGVNVYSDSVFIVSAKKIKPIVPNSVSVKKLGLHSDTFSAPFIRSSSTSSMGRYDIGLEPNSYHYRGKDSSEIKDIISNLKKNVVTPYAKFHGLDLSAFEYHSSPMDIQKDFIGIYDDPELGHNVTLYDGLELRAEDEVHRFYIYLALLTNNVCPVGKESKSEYKETSFVLIDKTFKKKASESAVYNNFSLIGKLHSFIESKSFNKLNGILDYCDFKATPPLEDSDVVHFMTYISDVVLINPDNVERVRKVLEETDENERDIYRQLKREIKKKDSIITYLRNQYLYNEESLGSNLKQIAKHIAERNDEPYSEIRQKLLVGNEN